MSAIRHSGARLRHAPAVGHSAANRNLTTGGFDRRRSDRHGGTLIFACRVPGGTAPSGTGVARECQAWRWPVHVQARHAHSRIGSAGRVTIRICRDPGPASYRRDLCIGTHPFGPVF